MSLKVFLDKKIHDASNTGGTGNLTMVGQAGSPVGNYLGNVAANGDEVVLCITDLAGNYEVSRCTVTIAAAVVTISRDTVLASSNDGEKAVFTGIQNISNEAPGTLAMTLFNLQYQTDISGSLTQMATDISDLKDSMQVLLDG